MKNNKITISVIVPIYNLEKKNLSRCIKSILKQTYKDYELLLINDGSTDGSLNICNEFAILDNRIKIINKQNGGVSSARNIGIKLCKGDYIAFIDGDDYIDNDYLERFIHLLPADLIIQSCKDFCYDLDKAKTQYHFSNKNYGNDFYELFSKYNLYNWGAPWARLFKSEIIKKNNIKFDTEIRYREDELFFLEYLRYCKVLKTDSYYGYHYIWYQNSATNKNYGFEHDFKVATRIYNESIHLGKEKNFNDDYKRRISSKCIISLFIALSNSYNIISDKKIRIKNIIDIKRFLKSNNLYSYLKSKYKILLMPYMFIDFIFIIKSKIK